MVEADKTIKFEDIIGVLTNPEIRHNINQEYFFTASDNGAKTIENGLYKVELRAGQHTNPPNCNSSFKANIRIGSQEYYHFKYYNITAEHKPYGDCSIPDVITTIFSITSDTGPEIYTSIYHYGGTGGYIKIIPIQ